MDDAALLSLASRYQNLLKWLVNEVRSGRGDHPKASYHKGLEKLNYPDIPEDDILFFNIQGNTWRESLSVLVDSMCKTVLSDERRNVLYARRAIYQLTPLFKKARVEYKRIFAEAKVIHRVIPTQDVVTAVLVDADGKTEYITRQLYESFRKSLTEKERKDRALIHVARLLLGYTDDRAVVIKGELDSIEFLHFQFESELIKERIAKSIAKKLPIFLLTESSLTAAELATEIVSKVYGVAPYSLKRGAMHTKRKKSMSEKQR